MCFLKTFVARYCSFALHLFFFYFAEIVFNLWTERFFVRLYIIGILLLFHFYGIIILLLFSFAMFVPFFANEDTRYNAFIIRVHFNVEICKSVGVIGELRPKTSLSSHQAVWSPLWRLVNCKTPVAFWRASKKNTFSINHSSLVMIFKCNC